MSETEARALVKRHVEGWPHQTARLAVEAGTGSGKTTHANAIAACHAAVKPVCEGTLLFVVHNKKRVEEITHEVRSNIERLGGDPGRVAPLLGRQAIDVESGEDLGSRPFGCVNHERARLFGGRFRGVRREVCKPCPALKECKVHGYLGHLEAALQAPVLVTTLARLTNLQDDIWDHVGAVIGDEDVMPGLLQEVRVLPSDLRRAIAYIRRKREATAGERRRPLRVRALLPILPLLEASLEVLKTFEGRESVPLVNLLPPDCEPYLCGEGAKLLRAAFPLMTRKDAAGCARVVRDENAMAEWERAGRRWTPRQVNGKLLSAMANDCVLGDSKHAATVRVERGCRGRGRARLHIVRYDARTIRHLRRLPLLLLDATLHPAARTLLDLELIQIRCQQGRHIVQALTRLTDLTQISRRDGDSAQLTDRGRHVLAQIAHWVSGHRAYVLCRTGIRKALVEEAKKYYELNHTDFVTVRAERGWSARKGADVFVVLGRYAKDPQACLREAHALRSVHRLLTASTDRLDALERSARPPLFRGRGRPLTYYGALLERPRRNEMPDRLAQLLQDEDRIASVVQFVGRNRTNDAYVLLLRGDPTIAVDALVHDHDLPTALTAADAARHKRAASHA